MTDTKVVKMQISNDDIEFVKHVLTGTGGMLDRSAQLGINTALRQSVASTSSTVPTSTIGVRFTMSGLTMGTRDLVYQICADMELISAELSNLIYTPEVFAAMEKYVNFADINYSLLGEMICFHVPSRLISASAHVDKDFAEVLRQHAKRIGETLSLIYLHPDKVATDPKFVGAIPWSYTVSASPLLFAPRDHRYYQNTLAFLGRMRSTYGFQELRNKFEWLKLTMDHIGYRSGLADQEMTITARTHPWFRGAISFLQAMIQVHPMPGKYADLWLAGQSTVQGDSQFQKIGYMQSRLMGAIFDEMPDSDFRTVGIDNDYLDELVETVSEMIKSRASFLQCENN